MPRADTNDLGKKVTAVEALPEAEAIFVKTSVAISVVPFGAVANCSGESPKAYEIRPFRLSTVLISGTPPEKVAEGVIEVSVRNLGS